ncbi:hypothetical protein [Azotobacter chroococcum]|uniref:hypothetical protein n=1 Tax=Azotobacter chroococcum TaxID=353 RepID=UPI0010AEE5CD|nr:hypothetical protein [Azotobacter chroococcum]TKD37243.1 hypothetical protein FCG41_15375 [Azotobacter chroococcum]
MSKIILGHPFSGALYGYLSDQIGKEYSHTRAIGSHGYYTTLYGKRYKDFVNQSLMFSLIYDEIFVTPADNHWPKSESLDSRDFHPELGLHAEWSAYTNLFNDTDGIVTRYLNDQKIGQILTDSFRIPRSNQKMVLSSILYELNLSRKHRCPILCSNGRKRIIERLIEIDRPAIHPTTIPEDRIEIVTNYMNVTGLLLSPKDLDNLIYVKGEAQVRDYAKSFLGMLQNYQSNPSKSNRLAILELARNAIEKEHVGKLASGLLNWLSTFFRLVGVTPLSAVSTGGSFVANWSVDDAKWYAFSGEIRKAESKGLLVSQIDKLSQQVSEEDESSAVPNPAVQGTLRDKAALRP